MSKYKIQKEIARDPGLVDAAPAEALMRRRLTLRYLSHYWFFSGQRGQSVMKRSVTAGWVVSEALPERRCCNALAFGRAWPG